MELADEDAVQYVDLPLEKAGAVSGTVVDEAGQPVPAVRVVLSYTHAEIRRFVFAGGAGNEEAHTNVAGIFAFEGGIKPGAAFRLEAAVEDYLAVYSRPLKVQAGQRLEGIVLRLQEKGFRVVLTVLDAAGRPVAGAPVSARSKIPPPTEFMPYFYRQISRSGFTDEKGVVEFKGLAPGPWVVTAADSAQPGPGSRILRKELKLSSTAAVKDLRVTLRPE